jgi:hypothetical protein
MGKYKRLGRKRLAIDIPEQIHQDMKYCAKIRNITLTRWVLRACYFKLKQERMLEDKINL